ncbi:hypothetical protein ES702_05515 [subsurface metagenome]
MIGIGRDGDVGEVMGVDEDIVKAGFCQMSVSLLPDETRCDEAVTILIKFSKIDHLRDAWVVIERLYRVICTCAG